MEALTYYVDIAKKEALLDGVIHHDDTYRYIKQMFEWRGGNLYVYPGNNLNV